MQRVSIPISVTHVRTPDRNLSLIVPRVGFVILHNPLLTVVVYRRQGHGHPDPVLLLAPFDPRELVAACAGIVVLFCRLLGLGEACLVGDGAQVSCDPGFEDGSVDGYDADELEE